MGTDPADEVGGGHDHAARATIPAGCPESARATRTPVAATVQVDPRSRKSSMHADPPVTRIAVTGSGRNVMPHAKAPMRKTLASVHSGTPRTDVAQDPVRGNPAEHPHDGEADERRQAEHAAASSTPP